MTDWQAINDIVLNLTAILLLVALVALVYLNSIDGAFVFDDTAVVDAVLPEMMKHGRGK